MNDKAKAILGRLEKKLDSLTQSYLDSFDHDSLSVTNLSREYLDEIQEVKQHIDFLRGNK